MFLKMNLFRKFKKILFMGQLGMALHPPLFGKHPPEIWKFAGSNVRKRTKPINNSQNPLVIL